MKKLIAFFLVLTLIFSMMACAAPAADETAAAAEEATEAETASTEVAGIEVSNDEKAAALGIPAAVVLQETDLLDGKKIGCSICYKGDEWCATLASALESLGAYYNADIACEDGDLNDETQTKQIENMIANNVDVMMIDPITPDGSTEALNKAVGASIPIVIYDGYWSEGAEKAVDNRYLEPGNDGNTGWRIFRRICKSQ